MLMFRVLLVLLAGLLAANLSVAAPDSTYSESLFELPGNTGRRVAVRTFLPVSATQAATLILVPGRGMNSGDYRQLASRLVEEGYLVVGIDSPGSARVDLPDGTVLPPDPALEPPSGLMAGPYEQVDAFFQPAAAAGARDIQDALDWLLSLPGFAEVMDVDRIGIIGHSLGGRIAGAAAARDQRIRAYLAVEAVPPREDRRTGMPVPSLVLLSEDIWPYAIANVRELGWCARYPTYMAGMADIGHNTITDSYGEAGRNKNSHGAIADLILAFFDSALARPGAPLTLTGTDKLTLEMRSSPDPQRPPQIQCNG